MNISLINILQGVVEDKNNSCLEHNLDVAKMMKEYTPFKEDEGVSIEHAKINADEIELNAAQIKHIYVSLNISNNQFMFFFDSSMQSFFKMKDSYHFGVEILCCYYFLSLIILIVTIKVTIS